MGCGASKTATVVPEQVPTAKPSQDILSSQASLPGSRQHVMVRQRKASSKDTLQSDSTSSLGSRSDTQGSLGSRNSSAHSDKSKGSSSSADSGLGEDYSAIITEKSDKSLKEVASVPEESAPPKLSIDGLAVNRKKKSTPEDSNSEVLPPGQKHVKFAEKLISELPDSPSILKRPASRGGMAFDVVVTDNSTPSMPAFSSNSKRKKRLTYQELQEKQRVAKQRKKEREQLMIERIKAREERDKQVTEALAKFAEMQTELAKIKQKKQEVSAQNREAYLHSLREKLQEKSAHIDEVKTSKKTKKLAPLNRPPRPNTGTVDAPVNLGAN